MVGVSGGAVVKTTAIVGFSAVPRAVEGGVVAQLPRRGLIPLMRPWRAQ